MNQIQVGSTLTNGNSAIRVIERGTGEFPGWLGLFISLGNGTLTGAPVFLADKDMSTWDHVPFEWATLPEVLLEHRYVWTPDCRALRHETRATR
jgi:hypothetical protein